MNSVSRRKVINLTSEQKEKKLDNKGMSVAIAAVILLSVTVALGLAVSSWITVFSVNSMETEALWVSDISYQGTSGASDNQIVLTIANPASYAVTILQIKVTGNNVDQLTDGLGVTIKAGESQTVTLNDVGWISGYTYQFSFLSARGNNFVTDDTA
jgi:FlaG/FlaF family flagellin (archaellin)